MSEPAVLFSDQGKRETFDNASQARSKRDLTWREIVASWFADDDASEISQEVTRSPSHNGVDIIEGRTILRRKGGEENRLSRSRNR